MHGWEIAVILRNFRKTKFSKSKFLLFFFFFNSISTCIQCATRRLLLCDIRKYRFPAFYGTSDRQAAIFCTRMIQTWNSFSLVDPCSIFFLFFSKTKIFHSHPCVCKCSDDNNDIEIHNWRFFTVSLLHHELSLTHKLKWSGRSHVPVKFKTSGSCHMQYVVWHIVQRNSSAINLDKFEIAFILALFHWLKPLTNEGGEKARVIGELCNDKLQKLTHTSA